MNNPEIDSLHSELKNLTKQLQDYRDELYPQLKGVVVHFNKESDDTIKKAISFVFGPDHESIKTGVITVDMYLACLEYVRLAGSIKGMEHSGLL